MVCYNRAVTATHPHLSDLGVFVAGVVLLVLVTWCGWICDDAFITLRTVDHALAGHGLVWNLGERVQAYTHPLWMGLMVAARAVISDAYLAIFALSWLTSALVIGLLVATFRDRPVTGTIALLGLAGSAIFVEWSTAGLENPLTHLLLLLALRVYTRHPPHRALLYLSWLTVAAMLNRLDTLLLFLPLLVSVGREALHQKALTPSRIVGVLLAGVPLLGWEVFSALYYGSFVPNTALAKLGTGIPRLDVLVQGVRYLGVSAGQDPTGALLLFGAVAGAVGQPRRMLPPLIGAGLYLMYVVWVGGDFMSGRFLSAPLVVAAWIGGVGWPMRRQTLMLLVALFGITGLLNASTPWRTGPRYGQDVVTVFPDGRITAPTVAGIIQERAVYFRGTSFVGWLRGETRPDWPGLIQAGEANAVARRGERVLLEGGAVGFLGQAVDPSVYILDRYCLTDPLRARLPMDLDQPWRIGHYERPIPDGYLESLESEDNRIVDPDLRAYYAIIRDATRAPVGSAAQRTARRALLWGQAEKHRQAWLSRQRP